MVVGRVKFAAEGFYPHFGVLVYPFAKLATAAYVGRSQTVAILVRPVDAIRALPKGNGKVARSKTTLI
jgi:hypothetical protein